MRIKIALLTTLIVASLSAWTNPVSVSGSTAGKNFFPQIVSDGESGAVISWLKKNDGCYEVYTQRIDSDGDIHDNWPSGGKVVSIMSLADHIGHRLNHHIAPGWYTSGGQTVNAGYAISFWANHFNITSATPYNRGYYLQRTSATGGLTWNSGNPVQVKSNVPPIPASSQSEDGDPISICPDGAGGCVVAMKHTRWGKPARVIVNRYDSDGTQHTGWSAGGLVVDSTETGELIGCPKIIQFDGPNGGDYMLVYATATNAGTGCHHSTSSTHLHFQEIKSDGTLISPDMSRVENSGDTLYFYWFNNLNLSTNSDKSVLQAAYTLERKGKWHKYDAPVESYTQQFVRVLEYTSSGSRVESQLDSWGAGSSAVPRDDMPYRAPAVAAVGNDAVVCYPEATDDPPDDVDNLRRFILVCKRVSSSVSQLWTDGGQNADNTLHTPRLISDGSSGYVVMYSRHTYKDYSSLLQLSYSVIRRYSPVTNTSATWSWVTPGPTDCSPQATVSNNHVIMVWSHSEDWGNTWTIKAQRIRVSDGSLTQ